MEEYIFIGKSLFFPKQGILVIGDLHIGFEYAIQKSGILIPEIQVEEIKKEMLEIFSEIKKRKFKLKKIIFIGDIKHSFSYEWKEKNYFSEIISFLREYIREEKIILIKGNHDTINYSFGDNLKDYFIQGEIAFIHGHKFFEEVFSKKIKTVVMGHLHPSIILSESSGIKREKYKCFLVGKFNQKKIIILPSFLSTREGTNINSLNYSGDFSIIPKHMLKNFDVFVIGDDKTYSFGKVKRLIKD